MAPTEVPSALTSHLIRRITTRKQHDFLYTNYNRVKKNQLDSHLFLCFADRASQYNLSN